MRLQSSYWIMAIVLAGCARASVAQQSQSIPLVSARPTNIVVYPFAVNTADVTLNQSIVQRAYRSLSNADVPAQQAQIAHDTAQDICNRAAAELTQKGYRALCQERGVPAIGSNVIVVDGVFTNINEGNRLRRLVIGFGAGASVLDTEVDVAQKTVDGTRQVMAFTTHADSGKMPGAAVTAGAGAAAGGSAAVIGGANAALGGAKTYTSATRYLAEKTSDQIVKSIIQYYSQQGWGA